MFVFASAFKINYKNKYLIIIKTQFFIMHEPLIFALKNAGSMKV
jgi:hypothetical protein